MDATRRSDGFLRTNFKCHICGQKQTTKNGARHLKTVHKLLPDEIQSRMKAVQLSRSRGTTMKSKKVVMKKCPICSLKVSYYYQGGHPYTNFVYIHKYTHVKILVKIYTHFKNLSTYFFICLYFVN